MATCYQKHPFEIEAEDHLTNINTKIFEIKKKIQLSEGQRKSHYEENEAEKQSNAHLIAALKKEVGERLRELARARAVIGEDELRVKKYLSQLCPVTDKTPDQVIYNLDLKVTEQRKLLDLARYERKKKKSQLKSLEKEYEQMLIDQSKIATDKIKSINPARKQASHLENEIHRVTVQWNEAELIKKKYAGIKHALTVDAVKFESSLSQMQELLKKQKEEIKKLEAVREEAAWMRGRATAALMTEQARVSDAEQARAQERAYFAQRFDERARELEKLEKRIFPAPVRAIVRQESTGSGDLTAVPEETPPDSSTTVMDDIFQKLMKMTGVTEAEVVFERIRAQRETAKRLEYLQRCTEEEKLMLEKTQNNLMAELEAYKFAEVKDKDEAQDQIEELKAGIENEIALYKELLEQVDKTNALLMEIKRCLYDFCKMLEGTSHAPLAEWTEDPRDVAPAVETLLLRFTASSSRAADIMLHNSDAVLAAIAAGQVRSWRASDAAAAGLSVHSTPRDTDQLSTSVTAPASAAHPLTYRELVQREPPKPPVSDEEEDIPSRSYLKRQAQLIVDTKSRRKGFRAQYPRK